MSKTAKTVVAIVVAILVIWFIWWIAGSSRQPAAPAVGQQQSASAVTATSDVDQDLTSVDAQMNGLSQDSANVDQSIQQ
jgi:hypothetical protein